MCVCVCAWRQEARDSCIAAANVCAVGCAQTQACASESHQETIMHACRHRQAWCHTKKDLGHVAIMEGNTVVMLGKITVVEKDTK